MVLFVSLAEKITKHFVTSFSTVSPSSQILTHSGVTCFRKLPIPMLLMPFDNTIVTLINKFIASAVAKINKIRKGKLHELEAPWLLK